ncbi:unnamed protein product [Polarella glacialis]|uniref:Major facilitator superfamily (MFS) profile domain-containing protein n=1 Tax=Polarella glacialis TaxID=89957 RepID=A0A813LQU9_POLGL|nr:unnamed protein product [Polarella glacialis]
MELSDISGRKSNNNDNSDNNNNNNKNNNNNNYTHSAAGGPEPKVLGAVCELPEAAALPCHTALDAASVWDSRRRTLALLCVVAAIEGADMQLLPATFHALEADLGFSPALLGKMSLAQSLLQSLTSPVWGVLADRHSRKQLLVLSCCAWGVLTLLLAASSSAGSMLWLRCLHGATLASLGPIAQSMVADVTEQRYRGTAYGCVSFGQIAASSIGTSIASATFLEFKAGIVALCLGLVASWCGSGVNRPILAEIVEPAGRASIIAWLAALEGSSAALLGAPVVGFLSESVFGYEKDPTAKLPGLAANVSETSASLLEAATRSSTNRRALGMAMLWGTAPGWLLCASLYTILHWYYWQDVQRARQRSKLLITESDDEPELQSINAGEADESRAELGKRVHLHS